MIKPKICRLRPTRSIICFSFYLIKRFYFIWTEISNPARNCCANVVWYLYPLGGLYVLPRSLSRQNFCFLTQARKAACRALQMMALAISNFVQRFSWNYISLSVAAWLVPIPVCWQARIKRLCSHASTQAFLFSNFVRSQPKGEIRTSKSNVIETDGKKIFLLLTFTIFSHGGDVISELFYNRCIFPDAYRSRRHLWYDTFCTLFSGTKRQFSESICSDQKTIWDLEFSEHWL